MESLLKLFAEFRQIPKGILIDNPDQLIPVGIDAFQLPVVFTRRTLKHLSEKGNEGHRLLLLVPDIIQNPDAVLKAKNNRILFVRLFLDKEGEPHVVIVEIMNENVAVVVTSFVTDK